MPSRPHDLPPIPLRPPGTAASDSSSDGFPSAGSTAAGGSNAPLASAPSCSFWHQVPLDQVGLDSSRFAHATRLLQQWCDSGEIPAAALVVGHRGRVSQTLAFGRPYERPDAPPLRDDAIFLIASITKPIVALGALQLVERGELSLDDRVERFIPEFGRHGKHAITVRHLLTHTSGLPDMLPNNFALRCDNAPLSAFVDGACRHSPDFVPGRGVQYQSLGFAVLGELIHRISGIPCADWLQEQLFTPLGMVDTALGAPDSWFEGASPKVNRLTEMRLPSEQIDAPHWNWNSRYWRQLGAPWGGLLSTPADLARLASFLLGWAPLSETRVISRASIAAATRNQLEAMREVPADDRRCRPWGLGWRLNWSAHSANFGDLLSPGTYGHWGATGTVLWIDPVHETFCTLLTTRPQEPGGEFLARISNIVAAALS